MERPQRVFLHIGAPKTGTTFVQSVLFHFRDALREQGVLYPAERYDEHFFAAVDLQDLDFSGEPRPEAAGTWQTVATRARSWPGTSIISHDVFAGASQEQAAVAVTALAPAQVHVVFTARDLGRQLPSHWQEDVKHGQRGTFAEWFTAIERRDEHDWQLRWFWQVEEIPEVLRRWGAAVPPERVHLVTVPHDDGRPDELWRRFATVIGVDPFSVNASEVHNPNTSLDVADVELVRRLNGLRDDGLTQAEYEHTVKGLLVHETLAHHPVTRRPGLPRDCLPHVLALSQQWVRQLESAGYDIVGDLAELLPVAPGDGATDPDSATDAEVAQTAAGALYAVLLQLRQERRNSASARDEGGRLRPRLERAETLVAEHEGLPHWERIKRTVVEISRTSPPVERALDLYRRARARRRLLPLQRRDSRADRDTEVRGDQT